MRTESRTLYSMKRTRMSKQTWLSLIDVECKQTEQTKECIQDELMTRTLRVKFCSKNNSTRIVVNFVSTFHLENISKISPFILFKGNYGGWVWIKLSCVARFQCKSSLILCSHSDGSELERCVLHLFFEIFEIKHTTLGWGLADYCVRRYTRNG